MHLNPAAVIRFCWWTLLLPVSACRSLSSTLLLALPRLVRVLPMQRGPIQAGIKGDATELASPRSCSQALCCWGPTYEIEQYAYSEPG